MLMEAASEMVLRQPEDYIRVRVGIRDAMRSRTDLDVFLLNSICETWFWDLDGLRGVEIINDDPAMLLRRKLQVPSLPAEIADPEIIVAFQLTELPVPDNPGTDLLAWVAKHKLG